ncbi:Saccharopine dehydrogenase C-terminal domain-containing protein [Rhizobium sp. NFACC06-2]|nr:Saccharopine dehydrogenase C-terminal domain-containing protein [Rhizobium sp. NFACC06-2]
MIPVVGNRKTYLCSHDEAHSLSQHFKGANVRFWMGFSDHYMKVFGVLKSLGMPSELPVVTADGQEVVPLKVANACLPNPASLAPDYRGNTCIGSYVKGIRNNQEKSVLIYNVSDHQKAYVEVGSQAISHTAGVPPVAAALLIANDIWDVKKMVNVEELPPRPFIDVLEALGLQTLVQTEFRGNLFSTSNVHAAG